MKKFLMVLGGLFAVLTVATIGGIFAMKYFGEDLDKESKAYVDANLPQIVGNWDPRELLDRASPEFSQVVPQEKVIKLFKILSQRLGPLKEYKGSAGQSNVLLNPEGKVITGDYKADAVFENGPAKIDFRIIRRDGQWQVLEFWVNSDVLLQ
ncbi:MAG TPA: hypothetical protein VNT26_16190 [Candidatus Sulfotelmatobacter sp.]|nr:hypothetical protein [Candidatus Sulfotelmatobacter sp.]